MPTELLTQLPQLSAIVEKLGVIGVLLIAVGWLVFERMRLMKELVKTYKQRDRARMTEVRYKGALDVANLKVDVSDIFLMFSEKEEA